jgi:hypothetical protein
MSPLKPSGNWPIFAGAAPAVEAIDTRRVAAAKVLTIPII